MPTEQPVKHSVLPWEPGSLSELQAELLHELLLVIWLISELAINRAQGLPVNAQEAFTFLFRLRFLPEHFQRFSCTAPPIVVVFN